MLGRTVLDNRGGRPSRWVLLPEGVERLMRVPDHMRKGVVFLYYEVGGDLMPAGTGFVAGYPLAEGEDLRHLKVILTAHHVIANIARCGDAPKVLIRMNTKSGGTALIETPLEEWRHDDPHVDCAMLPWNEPPSEMEADYHAFMLNKRGVATDAFIRSEGIGIGDEVFMVGLFYLHLGQDRIEPIVRVGNIAAIPGGPVMGGVYGNMRAILIEARSIGGLSGSPVFVHRGYVQWRDGELYMATDDTSPFHFLGIMHGHWNNVPSAGVDALAEDATNEKSHTGIGIVVPAEEIMRTITPFLEGEAVKWRKKKEDDEAPVLDAIPPADEFAHFEDLARKVVNVPKKELDEKRRDGS